MGDIIMALKPRVKLTSAPPADEAAVDAVINRGLSAGAPASATPAPDEAEKPFKLRLPSRVYDQVEASAKRRPGRVSVNTWINEAIAEKLAREGQGG